MDGAVRLLDGGALQLGAKAGLHVLDILLAQSLLLGFFGLRQAGGLALVCQLVDAGNFLIRHSVLLYFIGKCDIISIASQALRWVTERFNPVYQRMKPMSKQLNFAQQMDEVLKTLGPQRPKLLLHACCGPCSSAVLEKLCRYFEITVLYYNPNTWPAEEYHRRGEELKKFVAAAHPLGVTVVEDHYDPQEFYSAVTGLENEPERGSRCTICYRLRMRRAAQYASENGFDWFTTTLSISPHKDAKRINAIGQELEAEFGVKHLPSDFKKHNGYLRSLQLSEEYGLYRQDYCGCAYSKAAREREKQQKEQGITQHQIKETE